MSTWVNDPCLPRWQTLSQWYVPLLFHSPSLAIWHHPVPPVSGVSLLVSILSLFLPPSSWFKISFRLNYHIRFLVPSSGFFSCVWGMLLGLLAHLFNIISHCFRMKFLLQTGLCPHCPRKRAFPPALSEHLVPHPWNALPLISGYLIPLII